MLVRDETKRVHALIKSLSTKRVVVGIPESEAVRAANVPSNAELAYIHENGVGVTRRVFLSKGVENAQKRIENVLKKGLEDAFNDFTQPTRALESAGMIGRDAAKRVITTQDGIAPPLASTLAARSARGGTHAKKDKSLLDTGQLLNSITYEVR